MFFMIARYADPLSSTGGRMAGKRPHAATEAAFGVALTSTEETGTRGDSGVGLNLFFSLKLMMLLCSFMKVAPSTSAYGSPGTTRTASQNMRSTGLKTSGNNHNPTTAIGGTALPVEVAALSSFFPVGFAIDPPHPPNVSGSHCFDKHHRRVVAPPRPSVKKNRRPDSAARPRCMPTIARIHI